MTNQFRPLTATEKAETKNHNRKTKDEGKARIPIPDDAPQEMPEHYKLGTPSKTWEYKCTNGKLLHYVCRFIDNEGNKQDRPLTYRKFKDGSCRWAWKGLDAPRSLYGLDLLAAKPDAPVIICEGEKATDAASELFPDYVAVTSPNGAGSPHKSDWKSLQGRAIIIFPDNDNEGLKYAQRVARILKKLNIVSVSIVQIPDDFPEKWDLADALPEGYKFDDLQKLMDDAEIVTDPLDNLAERARGNTGEAYKSEVLGALAFLEQEDLPAYMTLRTQLKEAKVGITKLDSAIERRSKANNPELETDDLHYARKTIDHIGYENLISTNTHIWLWNDAGVWKTAPDRQIKQHVQNTLEYFNCEISRSLVDSVTDILKTEIYAPEHIWNINSDVINVANGELHWNGAQWELKPHCSENYSTTQIPVIYDTQADCPRFKQFINEIFEGDLDSKYKATALMEMIGYTLISKARFERFALLIGSGANGKSVVLEVITAMLGADNVCAVQPSQLSNKFQRAHLHLKLANLVTEIAEGGTIADAELKSITSGELITAEHKNKDPFDFKPFCTCWFGTNHLPHTRDFSDALFRRALVIPFNRQFKGKDADPHLKDKLIDELSGIMNLALQAFGDVLKRGTFTEPQSCLDAKQEWRIEADQVAQFIEDRCVLEPAHAGIESAALYTEYKSWADDAGIKYGLGHKNFTNRLVRLGCAKHKGTGGKRLIKGIRIGWET